MRKIPDLLPTIPPQGEQLPNEISQVATMLRKLPLEALSDEQAEWLAELSLSHPRGGFSESGRAARMMLIMEQREHQSLQGGLGAASQAREEGRQIARLMEQQAALVARNNELSSLAFSHLVAMHQASMVALNENHRAERSHLTEVLTSLSTFTVNLLEDRSASVEQWRQAVLKNAETAALQLKMEAESKGGKLTKEHALAMGAHMAAGILPEATALVTKALGAGDEASNAAREALKTGLNGIAAILTGLVMPQGMPGTAPPAAPAAAPPSTDLATTPQG